MLLLAQMDRLADYGLAGIILVLVFGGLTAVGWWAKGWVDKILGRGLDSFDRHAEAATRTATAMVAVADVVGKLHERLNGTHEVLSTGQSAILEAVARKEEASRQLADRVAGIDTQLAEIRQALRHQHTPTPTPLPPKEERPQW